MTDDAPDITIRPYGSGDAPAFRDLNMAWLRAFFHVEAKDEATLSDPEGTILAPGGQILLADRDGQTVGCVALVPMPNRAYEVAKMAVAPEAQGRGVGRLLLEAADRVGAGAGRAAAVPGKQRPAGPRPASVRGGGLPSPAAPRAARLPLCPRGRVHGDAAGFTERPVPDV